MSRFPLHVRALWLVPVALGCSDASAPAATPPTTGRYATMIHPLDSIRVERDIAYSVRPNAGGQYTSGLTRAAESGQATLTLRLDIARPRDATATQRRPLVVLVHGGGFVSGDKRDPQDWAVTYAQAGFVVASINYRLSPTPQATDSTRLLAIRHAVEDAQNAIRFLRSRADTWGIDPTRVVTIGTSAGGGISLTNGVAADDPSLLSDAPGISSAVAGAISTGATLTGESDDVLTWLRFDATDAPVLLFHAREQDNDTGKTWSGHVLPTQQRYLQAGIPCTVVAQPEGTHTVPLAVGGPYWGALWPFLWERLRLAALGTT